jgi:endogenous inhibitor of DNA gyrase (YacG/DUF329 family)
MIYSKCPHCGVSLAIDEDNNILGPGFREMEDVICPKCEEVVTEIFTTGYPSAKVIDAESSAGQ